MSHKSMDSLPTEILIQTFSYLDETDLFCCSGVCPSWADLVNFYGTRFDGKSISRAKIYSDRVKYYNDTDHLKTVHFSLRKTDETVHDCVIKPLINNLDRLIYRDVTNYDVTTDLTKFHSSTNFHLTHIYFDNVLMSKDGFILMCQKLSDSLQQLYLCTYKDEENCFDQTGLSEGVRYLVTIKHLDMGSLALNVQPDQKESIFLQTVSAYCPNLMDLAVSESFQVSSQDLLKFLKSENTKNLRFLNVIGSSRVDDTIDEALQYRMKIFQNSVPKLTIFTEQTQITELLSMKYSPFNVEGMVQDDKKPGAIIIDCQGVPPYGSLDDYPFLRSTVSDWPTSADSEVDDDHSSASGGHLWYDFDDLHDDLDVDEYDDYLDDEDVDFEGGDAEFYD